MRVVELEDEVGNGSRMRKKVQNPREPTEEERAQSEVIHLRYGSWCRQCVRGRGKQIRQGAQETSMIEVRMDFAFLDREDDPQRRVPVLVVKERTSKMVMSPAVHRKTTAHIAKECDCEKLGACTET